MRREYTATSLDDGRIITADGYSLNISLCGINHHPAGPHSNVGTFHYFASRSRQDRLEDGLVRIDVSEGIEGTVTHYLSIANLEIVGPRFLRRKTNNFIK